MGVYFPPVNPSRRRREIGAVFGHSFAARSTYLYTNGVQGFATAKNGYGLSAWTEALSGGRVLMPHELNFGVNGENTTQMLARCDVAVAAAVAAKASFVVFMGLFNDATATTAQIATTIANVKAIAQKWTDAGIKFIATGDFPSGSSTLTTYRRSGSQLQGFAQCRRWMIEVLPTLFNNVIVFDIWDQIGDWKSSLAECITSYFDPADQLHPFNAFYRAVFVPKLLSVLDYQFSTLQELQETSLSEAFDAAFNPRGNLIANGIMNGNASGLATSWTKTDASGITGTASKVAGTNIEWQQISYSGTAAAAGAVSDLRQNLSFSTLAAGDTLVATCVTEHDAGAVNLRGLELRLVMFDTVGGSNTYESKSFSWATAGDVIGNGAFTGANALFHRTLPLKLPAGALASGASGYLALRALWDAAATSSAVVRVGKVRLHKII